MTAEGRGRNAWVEVRTPSLADGGTLELHALGTSGGGRIELSIDGGAPEQIDTNSRRPRLVRHRVPLTRPGTHVASLRVRGYRPVRLLGVVIEQNAPGIVYDVLGINGHRASAIMDWDQALLRDQLEHRQPDLVILAYGGNEALDPGVSPRRFGEQLERALDRLRPLAPSASFLVVGPIAMCTKAPQLEHVRPEVPKVVATARATARAWGAAFWDASGVMGGPEALCGWRHRSPPLVSGDNLHLSREGYTIVGAKFAEALLAL